MAETINKGITRFFVKDGKEVKEVSEKQYMEVQKPEGGPDTETAGKKPIKPEEKKVKSTTKTADKK